MNVCSCFLSLKQSVAWRILLLLFCMPSLFFPIHLFFGLPCVVVPVTSGPLLLITCTCWWQVYRTNRVKRWWLGTWRATRTICTSVSPATEFHRRPCVRSASQSNVSILYTMHHLIFPISQSVSHSVQSINQSINLFAQTWESKRATERNEQDSKDNDINTQAGFFFARNGWFEKIYGWFSASRKSA